MTETNKNKLKQLNFDNEYAQGQIKEFRAKFQILQSVFDTRTDLSDLVDTLTEYVLDKWEERNSTRFCEKKTTGKIVDELEAQNLMKGKDIAKIKYDIREI